MAGEPGALQRAFLAAGLTGRLDFSTRRGCLHFSQNCFCLGCVLRGGPLWRATAPRKIFVIQALPAAIAIIAVLLAS